MFFGIADFIVVEGGIPNPPHPINDERSKVRVS
jgi:hypothetical protein